MLQEWDTSVPAVKQVDNEYDIAGRVRRTADALGNYSVMDYFAATGLVKSVSVPVKSTDPVGAKTFYEYDPSGNRTKLTDPVGNVTLWEYDELNRVTKETTAMLEFFSGSYLTIAKSRLWDHSVPLETTYTDREGRVTTYIADPVNRFHTEEWKDASGNVIRMITQEFNAAWDLVETKDTSGSLTWTQGYDYNNLSWLTQDTFESKDGSTVRYTTEANRDYTDTGVQDNLIYKLGTTTRFTQAALVDGLDRIYSLTQTNPVSGHSLLVTTTYQVDGRVEYVQRTNPSNAASDLVATWFTYFSNGDLQAINHSTGTASPAPSVNTFTYSYDDAHLKYENDDGVADFHAAGRHTHITELLRNGATLPEAQKLARRSDIKMTMRYVHIGLGDQAKAVANLPAAALHRRCISGVPDRQTVSADGNMPIKKESLTSWNNKRLGIACRRFAVVDKLEAGGHQ